jgi:hypothetical protein
VVQIFFLTSSRLLKAARRMGSEEKNQGEERAKRELLMAESTEN